MDKEYASNFFEYLNKLYKFNKLNNHDFEITSDMVYTVLINYGVIEKDSVENLFNIWIERFKTRPGIHALRTDNFRYFCQFINPGFNGKDAIKIYVPLKKHNLDENVTRIFEFIRSNNIMHYSKVAKVIRNDNVVIRVSNQKDADRIIDFISSDENIRKALNPVSPLTFNYRGVGIARDGDLSYNMELCVVIASCLNRGMMLDVNNFTNYLKQKAANESNADRKMIYEIGSKLFKDLSFASICNMENDPNKDDEFLFEAMRVTKEKYNITQVKRALYEYICNSNPNFFTRGNDRNRDYRSELCSNLTPTDVLNIVKKKVGEVNNISVAIEKFVNSIYADEISRLKETENISVDHYLNYLKMEYDKGNHDLASIIKNQRIQGNHSMTLIQNKIIKQLYPSYSERDIDALFIDYTGYYIIANLAMQRRLNDLDKEEDAISEIANYYLDYLEKTFYYNMNYDNFVLFISNQFLANDNIKGIKTEKILHAILEYLYHGNYYLAEKACKSDNVAVVLADLIIDRLKAKEERKSGSKKV